LVFSVKTSDCRVTLWSDGGAGAKVCLAGLAAHLGLRVKVWHPGRSDAAYRTAGKPRRGTEVRPGHRPIHWAVRMRECTADAGGVKM
jgi:hypothetical protein